MGELQGLTSLFGGGGGGGGGLADPSSATSQASPFDNINSGIFFGSEVGGVTEAPVSADATTPNARQQQALLPLASAGSVDTGIATSPTMLLLGIGAAALLAVVFIIKKG